MRPLLRLEDAEAEPMPTMLRPVNWEVVKADIRREVRAIA